MVIMMQDKVERRRYKRLPIDLRLKSECVWRRIL